MSCKFQTAYSGSIENVFKIALNELSAWHGQFDGDINGGSFSVNALGSSFQGKFFVKQNFIEWEISKKPFYIPCTIIENFVKTYVN